MGSGDRDVVTSNTVIYWDCAIVGWWEWWASKYRAAALALIHSVGGTCRSIRIARPLSLVQYSMSDRRMAIAIATGLHVHKAAE